MISGSLWSFLILNLIGLDVFAKVQNLLVIILIGSLIMFGVAGFGKVSWGTYFQPDEYWMPNGVMGMLESGGLRFEMLDAVFDGQKAMVELRLTVLDPDLLERLQEQNPSFGETEILLENSRDVGAWGYSSAPWTEAYPEEEAQAGQYSLVFSINDEILNAGGSCGIRLQDLVLYEYGSGAETLLPGEWTLFLTLRPTKVLRLEPDAVCRVNGVDWILDGVTLSPLALGLTFHREDRDGRYSRWSPCRDLSLRLKNGEILDIKGSAFVGSSNAEVEARIEFPVPLDLDQAESLRVCGVDIPLHE